MILRELTTQAVQESHNGIVSHCNFLILSGQRANNISDIYLSTNISETSDSLSVVLSVLDTI